MSRVKRLRNKWWTLQLIPHDKGNIKSINIKLFPILVFMAILATITILITTGAMLTSMYMYQETKVLDDQIHEQDGVILEVAGENQNLKETLHSKESELKVIYQEFLNLQKYIDHIKELEQQIRELEGNAAALPSFNANQLEENKVKGLMQIASMSSNNGHYSLLFELQPLLNGQGGSTEPAMEMLTVIDTELDIEVDTALFVEELRQLQEEASVQADALTKLVGQIEEAQYRALFIPSIAPASGRYTSGFGYRRDPFTGRWSHHNGLDIASSFRSPVVATANGTVTYAGYNGGHGNFVRVNHGNGYVTSYSHLSQIKVKVGDKVERGDLVGTMGSTGRSTGVHVHYEITKNGSLVNPRSYIGGR